jgi:AT-rich interactive domain-containing protein 1
MPPYATDNSNMSFGQDHDDDTSMSNSDEPSCSSPKLGSISTKSAAHNAEILAKVAEMGGGGGGDEAPRKEFASRLQKLWEEYNIVCRNLPNISKQPLDLFKLYVMVKEKGGFTEVTKSKAWKDVSVALGLGQSAPAALNVRKKYVSLGVFHYECRHDLSNADPLPMIAEMERSAQSAKKERERETSASSKSKANTSSGNTNDSLTQPSTPSTPNPNASSLTGSAKKKKKEKSSGGVAASSINTPALNANSANAGSYKETKIFGFVSSLVFFF